MRRGTTLLVAAVAVVAVGYIAGISIPAADTFAVQAPSLVVPVSGLPPAARIGALAYVTDCRAVTGVIALAIVLQPAGAGTGCLASFNGTVWNVGGTTMQVTR